jgi:hypothetical protein
MIHDGTTEFFTEHEVSYSAKGVSKETNLFVLREPGMDHFKHYMRIKQMFMQVFREIGEKRKAGDEPEDISGEEVQPIEEDHQQSSEEFAEAMEMLLLTSEKVGVPDFVEAFRAMACMRANKPVVMLDGEQAMTDAIWMTMHPDDAYKMAISWAAFFAMPSADGPKTSSSKPSNSASRAVVV